jgi:flagellar basal body-associated protein FliL
MTKIKKLAKNENFPKNLGSLLDTAKSKSIRKSRKTGKSALPEANPVHSSYISTTIHRTGGNSKKPLSIFASGKPKPVHAPTTKQTLTKRAKARYFTRSVVEGLAELDSPLKYGYTTTMYCSGELTQVGDKITTKYCNHRWCMVCNRIRVAKCINGYLPELEKMAEPYFITLTVPNVPSNILAETINSMVKNWQLLYKRYKKAKIELKGIRKLECTYNAEEDTYHPHFHFTVEGKGLAEMIVRDWLNLYPNAVRKAQDFKPAIRGKLVELFKYFTKIVTQTTEEKLRVRIPGKINGTIYYSALDQIFRAMVDHRVFQPFGIKKISEKIEDLTALQNDGSIVVGHEWSYEGMKEEQQKQAKEAKEAIKNAIIWQWSQDKADWINNLTGARLTGNKPAAWVKEIMLGAVF